MSKDEWVSEKVGKLIDEGKTRDEAVAIANSMWDEKHKELDEAADAVDAAISAPVVEAVTVAVDEKALLDRIWDGIQARIKDALPTPEPKPGFGFTVYKDAAGQERWLAIYSNNFEDREREIFSEKGFDDYVARLDMGVIPMPRLRSWHVRGTEYGTADWVDRIGHFFVATGTYDDSDLGRTGKTYDAKHWKEYGVSHGLLYRASDKTMVDGRAVYSNWNTFEISPLPHRRAANDLTAFAVDVQQDDALKEADMDQEKRKHLVDKFGEEYVVKLESLTEERGKEIEALRAYKDFVHPAGETTDAAEVEVNKEALENADKAFGELMPELMADAGEAVAAALAAVKAVTTLQTENAALRQELTAAVAALNERLDGAPRKASKDIKTRLSANDPAAKLLDKSLEQERLEASPVLGNLFKNGNAPD